jgi:hypothetical protein
MRFAQSDGPRHPLSVNVDEGSRGALRSSAIEAGGLHPLADHGALEFAVAPADQQGFVS